VRASREALTSAFTATSILVIERSLKDTANKSTCNWCGKILETSRTLGVGGFDLTQSLCPRCALIAFHSLELARQLILEVPKGGIQLYLGIERTGKPSGLVSVKRWSPFEPLESADSAERHLHTYPLPSE